MPSAKSVEVLKSYLYGRNVHFIPMPVGDIYKYLATQVLSGRGSKRQTAQQSQKHHNAVLAALHQLIRANKSLPDIASGIRAQSSSSRNITGDEIQEKLRDAFAIARAIDENHDGKQLLEEAERSRMTDNASFPFVFSLSRRSAESVSTGEPMGVIAHKRDPNIAASLLSIKDSEIYDRIAKAIADSAMTDGWLTVDEDGSLRSAGPPEIVNDDQATLQSSA